VSASAPFSEWDFNFSEAIDPSTVSIADIQSFTINGNAVSLVNNVASVVAQGNVLKVVFTGGQPIGTWAITLGPDIRDLAGNAMAAAYAASIQVTEPDVAVTNVTVASAADFTDIIPITYT